MHAQVELPGDPMELFVQVRKSMSTLDQTLHAKLALEGGPTGPREDPLGSAGGSTFLTEAEAASGGLQSERSFQMGSLPGSFRGQGLVSQAMKRSASRGSKLSLARTISQTADMHGEPEIWKVLRRLITTP
jgi:hypothetical protein